MHAAPGGWYSARMGNRLMHRNRLGVFVRVPVPGRVKTRMVPPLSPEAACELYRAFLGDLFDFD